MPVTFREGYLAHWIVSPAWRLPVQHAWSLHLWTADCRGLLGPGSLLGQVFSFSYLQPNVALVHFKPSIYELMHSTAHSHRTHCLPARPCPPVGGIRGIAGEETFQNFPQLCSFLGQRAPTRTGAQDPQQHVSLDS